MKRPHLPDGVSRYAATDRDLQRFDDAQAALSRFAVPVLHDAGNPTSHIFFAFFDGTGNDAFDPRKGDTNVEHLSRSAQRAALADARIGTFYLAGPGTQQNPAVALFDGMRGHSYDARLETMYFEFCRWATARLAENPAADISLANTGFSRGAEQAAGFTRMVAERGIRSVETADVQRDREGLIVHVTYRGPALRTGSEIAQAQLLFDPVATGEPEHRDRRPPPTALTALQITSLHERRDLFEGTRILDPGLTHGGRFLNVAVPGDHTDNGGSYEEDGLARRTHNIGADFLNSVVQPPIFEKRHLRPDLDVIHRSVEHRAIYDDDTYRANERRGLPEDQLRSHRDVLNGRTRDRSEPARDAEAIDATLDARFRRRSVEIGPVPETPAEYRDRPPAQYRDDLQPEAPRRPWLQLLLSPIADAEGPGAREARRDALAAYLESPHGRAFSADVEARSQSAREAEAMQRAQQAEAQQAEQYVPRMRVLA